MIQFYFLSVLFNAVGGYILFTNGREGGDSAAGADIRTSLGNETFRLVLGILSAVTGLLKLLSPVEGDIPVVGDIIPAIVGMITGLILLFDYYQGRSFFEEGDSKMKAIITGNRKWIGFAAMLAAGLHFILPRVLLL
ncbi:MAG: hypothetical protein LBH51_10185 [Treponema sp.]|jgi:hypothetical protein|nr:hypothetical protein [Treponema sp.]